jgi:hypothetical protein
VTNRIRAGRANRATIIKVNPVIEPIRASFSLVLLINRNATEYTMAAAGL